MGCLSLPSVTLEHSASLKQKCDLALCSASSLKRSDPGDDRSTGQVTCVRVWVSVRARAQLGACLRSFTEPFTEKTRCHPLSVP